MQFLDDEGNKIEDLKGVDIGGKSFQLPSDMADALISFRDNLKQSSSNEVEELKNKYTELVKEKENALNQYQKTEKEKREIEMAKAGELEALKESIASEWQEKIKNVENERNEMKNKILDSEIRNTIASVEGVNTNAIDDIFLKIKYSNPEFSEDGNIKVGEKELSEAVKEVVDSKDYYRVVKTPSGTGPSTKPAKPGVVSDEDDDPYNLVKQGFSENS